MYYFIDNLNVSKTSFERYKNYHTKYDLVIDTKTKNMAIFSSTNTDFVFHTTNLYVNYKLNYEVTCFNCNHCVDCTMCNKCENSKNLSYCFNCINCENCSYASNCKQVTNGKYMNKCMNSSVLYMCKEVVDSNNIDYCNLIDDSYDTSYSSSSKYICSSSNVNGSMYVSDSNYVEDSCYIATSKFIKSCEIVSICYNIYYSRVAYLCHEISNCSFIAHGEYCDEIELMKTNVNTDKKIEEIKNKIVKDIAKYGIKNMYSCVEDNIPYDHRLHKCIDKQIYDKNKNIATMIDELEINDYIRCCSECTNVYNCEQCSNISDVKFIKNCEGHDYLSRHENLVECICLTDDNTSDDSDVSPLNIACSTKRNHRDSDSKSIEDTKNKHCMKKSKN